MRLLLLLLFFFYDYYSVCCFSVADADEDDIETVRGFYMDVVWIWFCCFGSVMRAKKKQQIQTVEPWFDANLNGPENSRTHINDDPFIFAYFFHKNLYPSQLNSNEASILINFKGNTLHHFMVLNHSTKALCICLRKTNYISRTLVINIVATRNLALYGAQYITYCHFGCWCGISNPP